ncbi:hypothetical protein FA15DRAFT_727411 [Coprinopsis marcescibilis]|uniref:Nudix hydrolase domain-containing protein n=1 Tax=Coprinopsis marcescibilis TaxID=230819 RepID=A0A5C3KGZ4_COPMA|nr:hypothetical protein FA15DRAFT_727411 [Coprinopsis marcescibilis]
MFDTTIKPIPTVTPEELAQFKLSNESQVCIKRLISLGVRNEAENKACSEILSQQPVSRLAAVLVLLYEQNGQLRVLLTTRSKQLRTHAGQTALPGGRADVEDKDWVATARREAEEEVSLPIDSPYVRPLVVLQPHISLHRLFVTPVIALLTNTSVLKDLKASEKEVAKIFSYPLEAILDPSKAHLTENLVDVGSDDWIYKDDYYNSSDSAVNMFGGTTYRMHRFRTSASPIKGLTSDILIKVAELAFDRSTVYERYASEQIRSFLDVTKAVKKFEEESENSNGNVIAYTLNAAQ